MRTHLKLMAALLSAASAIAMTCGASAQEAAVESVVVTGSRVISNAANSPTPLTEVSIEQLQATTPSTISDGLNKLPVFAGSLGPNSGAGSGGSSNQNGNVLNLRNFGGQRTLVLMDGHRVTPANADGTVDIDTLPTMLVSRVDVVTGGASAVYGSDAVTGVVNFVLDTKFDGLKIDVNGGVSNTGDGARQQIGAAWGTELFGGRGHVEASARLFHQDIVIANNRPYGPLNPISVGGGTAANPFTIILNGTQNNRGFGGLIGCSGSCPANGMQFLPGSAVSIGPFNKGTATGTGTISIGGDGAYFSNSAAISGLRSYDGFARFSYDLDDTTTFYVQASAAESHNMGRWIDNAILPGPAAPGTFFVNNAYIPASAQAQFGTASTFTLTKVIIAPQYGDSIRTSALNRNLNVTAGLDGKLFGSFAWDAYYTHGENRLSEVTLNNTSYQRLYAATDAVFDASGNITCNVLKTASASAYAGCVPINPFGNTITQAGYNYITGKTYFDVTNTLDDLGGSISGEILELPAGPVKAAISGEARWLSYAVGSPFSPTATVDCTNLRNCSPNAPLWLGGVVAPVQASQSVWEFAGETDIPVVKDLPLIQAFNVNLAGRYTDYSTSGGVQTWKIGLDWHINDDVRLRGTNSIDIRAPTLNDLFLPLSATQTGFPDLLTNVSNVTSLITQGNPNLVPEVARTYTAGVVLTPSFIPGLTASLDYYRITVKNAIGSLSGLNTQIQNLCNNSGGTSQYCALYRRPISATSTAAANYPTAVLSQNLNTALLRAEGLDFETDYNFEASDIVSSASGSITLRALFNYQPMNETQQFPGSALTTTASPVGQPEPKSHATLFAQYQLEDWKFGLQDHWASGFNPSIQPGVIIWKNPSHVDSFNTFDINIDRTFDAAGGTFDAYFNVQNIGNEQPPIYTNASGSIGLNYPTLRDEDRMGRYFTIGVRAKF